jgi:hypothetical protein
MTPEEEDFVEALSRRLKNPRAMKPETMLKLSQIALQQKHITSDMSADEQASRVRAFWLKIAQLFE